SECAHREIDRLHDGGLLTFAFESNLADAVGIVLDDDVANSEFRLREFVEVTCGVGWFLVLFPSLGGRCRGRRRGGFRFSLVRLSLSRKSGCKNKKHRAQNNQRDQQNL